MTRRSRLRALVADVLWQLAHVDRLAELYALAAPVARLQRATACDPPTCRALTLAYRQTERRLVNRAWGGLLDALAAVSLALARVAGALAGIMAGIGQALAGLRLA